MQIYAMQAGPMQTQGHFKLNGGQHRRIVSDLHDSFAHKFKIIQPSAIICNTLLISSAPT
jgi:hypothetical protein